ncbi:unnamed protein product [Effrenium voratum]|nr:unnamed protein product [Effrenium voratum]
MELTPTPFRPPLWPSVSFAQPAQGFSAKWGRQTPRNPWLSASLGVALGAFRGVARRGFALADVKEREGRLKELQEFEKVYPSTWSNPSGAVLRQLDEDLFVAERPFIWNSIDVGGKMAVVRLDDGSLWVHSPVQLDAPLRLALSQLGPVRHIVSPNFEHVKWAKPWKEAFPEAVLWGTPGMRAKFPEIPYDQELPVSGESPWPGMEICFADCERTPILGTPFFNEVIFYHKPSSTMMCTDIFWNYPEDVPKGSALWKFLMDKIYLPFYKRFMARAAPLEAVLGRVKSWKPHSILPCHGRYVKPSDVEEVFANHLR